MEKLVAELLSIAKSVFVFIRSRLTKKRLVFVPNRAATAWSIGTTTGNPSMHLHCRCTVTNVSNQVAQILDAEIISPRKARSKADLVSIRHHAQQIYGTYPVPPDKTTDVEASFTIQPPILGEGDDLRTTLIFIDNFAKKYKVKKVLFQGPKPKDSTKAAPQPKSESLHAIQDPIEKHVASVLKDELVRYAECGRRVGGLGTIQTTYQGETFRSIGTEWRKADSPENKSIVSNPMSAKIESPNADALQSLYENVLSSDEDRSRFVTVLLARLSRESEYAPIGYFILLVLFRTGHLVEVLDKAKRDLQGDGGYGFSDLLRLLDGLLRFKHHLFSSTTLDHIERFVEGVDESTFRIQERIAAIRTAALLPRERRVR